MILNFGMFWFWLELRLEVNEKEVFEFIDLSLKRGNLQIGEIDTVSLLKIGLNY